MRVCVCVSGCSSLLAASRYLLFVSVSPISVSREKAKFVSIFPCLPKLARWYFFFRCLVLLLLLFSIVLRAVRDAVFYDSDATSARVERYRYGTFDSYFHVN